MFHGRCSTCDESLVFVPTKGGKQMPCLVAKVALENVQGGQRYAVKPSGDEGCSIRSGAAILDDPKEGDSYYLPHWGGCNAPDLHRRQR
jgi:hypothetical protein